MSSTGEQRARLGTSQQLFPSLLTADECEGERAGKREQERESTVLPIYPPRGKHSENSIKFQTLLY